MDVVNEMLNVILCTEATKAGSGVPSSLLQHPHSQIHFRKVSSICFDILFWANSVLDVRLLCSLGLRVSELLGI